MSRPGSRSWPPIAAQTEFRFGWLVDPDMDARAMSAMSTPASAAAIMEAALSPDVS